MTRGWIEWVGWIATSIFVGSYFFSKASLLRAAQMLGALVWIAYGCLISASPVVVANLLVFAAATWTLLRPSRATGEPRRVAARDFT
jgi:hypothetical protein